MNAHVKAATRARLLGNLVRGRAARHPKGRAIEAAASHLHDVAAALLDSADELTGHMPEDAETALWAAFRELKSGDTGIPTALLWYVTAPVNGYGSGLPELDLIHPALRFRERELRARHLYVIEMGHLNSPDDEVAMAALGSLLDVHREWDELTDDAADELRRDRSRPTTYRTADGRRSAEHLRGRLTIFEGPRVIAEPDVPDWAAPGEVWQLIKDAPALEVPADEPRHDQSRPASPRPADGRRVIADTAVPDPAEPGKVLQLFSGTPAAA
ncbi:hypothetical protein [Streptomyces sp. NBC_00120]|uniref:hypothetical protein n=1 Tax=Streptomyces sp. NBC_00120 TaxID=2975660 RepID=UPI002256A831|nr:hypothetical protein [Streptomyces sp. NBC_00120]MCX5326321.1 hypothetical protein [Streptomyces sp. NBC_00120]